MTALQDKNDMIAALQAIVDQLSSPHLTIGQSMALSARLTTLIDLSRASVPVRSLQAVESNCEGAPRAESGAPSVPSRNR
jgi:hypothetical protein